MTLAQQYASYKAWQPPVKPYRYTVFVWDARAGRWDLVLGSDKLAAARQVARAVKGQTFGAGRFRGLGILRAYRGQRRYTWGDVPEELATDTRAALQALLGPEYRVMVDPYRPAEDWLR